MCQVVCSIFLLRDALGQFFSGANPITKNGSVEGAVGACLKILVPPRAVACRSGFTRERAEPAGQSPPAVHRCHRHRIRG
ncbi:hypothetical protein METHP14_1370006 [Pseudomonas sp. P14-2025]